MPHQSDRDLPKSSPASVCDESTGTSIDGLVHHADEIMQDHDSADSVTTTTDQQPIMTPGTTAPKSETYGMLSATFLAGRPSPSQTLTIEQ